MFLLSFMLSFSADGGLFVAGVALSPSNKVMHAVF